jgi:threonine/homoserine/homoserine lactone efflux protein
MTNDLWLYFLAVLAVILLPGMDMAYVLASSLSNGRRGAVSAVAGIVSGGVIHVLVGATGVASLMAIFPALFHILLALGTLYLVWIGWNIYRHANTPEAADSARVPGAPDSPSIPSASIYRRAVMTCLLNPKAYAFTFAIFPAFMRGEDASGRDLVPLLIALCLITAATQIAVYGAVAALAVRSARFMRTRRAALSRSMGIMLMAAALLTALQAWSGSVQARTAIAIDLTEETQMASPPAMPERSATRPARAIDKPGRADFDFEVGDWRVENRKMIKPLRADSAWETFTSTVHMEKLPGDIGNFDTFVAPEWRPGWMGMAIRLFNGETGLWSIYLANNRTGGIVSATGQLDVPVVGRFENGTGVFEGDDVIDGVALRCRYTWYDTATAHPKWRQDFSFDGGKTWKPNWFMTYTRIGK